MEPVQTFDMERFMAAIEQCRRDELASRSKRLSAQRLGAVPIHALPIAASIVVAACILVAGCSGDDDRTTPTAAAETAPMLSGTRAAGEARAELGAGAQKFETASPARERDAQGPLLPPVMHSAD